jgi:hypothetical protein
MELPWRWEGQKGDNKIGSMYSLKFTFIYCRAKIMGLVQKRRTQTSSWRSQPVRGRLCKTGAKPSNSLSSARSDGALVIGSTSPILQVNLMGHWTWRVPLVFIFNK